MAEKKPVGKKVTSSPFQQFQKDYRSGKIQIDLDDLGDYQPTSPTTTIPGGRRRLDTGLPATQQQTPTSVGRKQIDTSTGVSQTTTSATIPDLVDLNMLPAYRTYMNQRLDAELALPANQVGAIATGKVDRALGILSTVDSGIRKAIGFDIVPDSIPLVGKLLDVTPAKIVFPYAKGAGQAFDIASNIAMPIIRAFPSTIKEVGDEFAAWNAATEGNIIGDIIPGKGRPRGKEGPAPDRRYRLGKSGFSAKDWIDQTMGKKSGITSPGKENRDIDIPLLVGDIVDPESLGGGGKWVNRTWGLIANLAGPENFVAGAGAITKFATARAVLSKADELYAAKKALEVAELAGKTAPAIRTLDAAGQVVFKPATQVIEELAPLVPKAELKVAEKTARLAEAQRQLALARFSGDKAAEAAALKELKKAQAVVGRVTPTREIGATANREMATELMRELELQKAVANLSKEELLAKGLTEADQLVAKRFVEVMTPDVLDDIASRGYAAMRGPVQEILGQTGGLRIWMPWAGKYKIPGTEFLYDAMGQVISVARHGNFSSRYLSKIPILKEVAANGLTGPKVNTAVLNAMTPTNEGLWFKELDLAWRVSVRENKPWKVTVPSFVAAGKEFPQKVLAGSPEDARYLLDLNTRAAALIKEEQNANLALLNFVFEGNKGKLESALDAIKGGEFTAALNTIDEFMSVPQELWTRQPNAIEQKLITKLKGLEQAIDGGAKAAYEGVGYMGPLATKPKGIPRVMTEAAKTWAAKYPDAADEVYDAIEFARFQNPNATIYDLNVAAQAAAKNAFDKGLQSGPRFRGGLRGGTILPEFNWFELNAADAYKAYVNSVAKDNALLRLIAQESANQLSSFTTSGKLMPTVASDLTGYNKVVDNLLTSDDVRNFSPELLDLIETKMNSINKILGDKNTSKVIIKSELDEAIAAFEETVRLAKEGALAPGVEILAANEAENFLTRVAQLAEGAKGAHEIAIQNPKRWKEASDIIDLGYEEMINMVNQMKLRVDPALRDDLALLFANTKRIADPRFARQLSRYINNANQMFKSYWLMTLGYINRNLFSDTLQMVSMGAHPNNLDEGVKVLYKFRDWLQSNPTWLQQLSTNSIGGLDAFRASQLTEFIKTLPKNEQLAARFALENIGALGLSNVGEALLGTVAKRTGFFGTTAKTKTSYALGTPLRAFGKWAESVEDYKRFAVLYDGIKQGYSPQQAVARVNKWFIDYSATSNLDSAVTPGILFWKFWSRNLPLQIEAMWTRPAAYNIFNKAREGMRDTNTVVFEEKLIDMYSSLNAAQEADSRGDTAAHNKYMEEYNKKRIALEKWSLEKIEKEGWDYPFIPKYLTDRGTFPTAAGGVFQPPFSLIGGGEENPEKMFQVESTLNRLSPLWRVPAEVIAERRFLTGQELYPADVYKEPGKETLKYAIRETVAAPLQQYGRYAQFAGNVLSFIPGLGGITDEISEASASKLAQELIGIKPARSLSDEEVDAAYQSSLSFIGSPWFPKVDAQMKGEIWRRAFQFRDEIARRQASK